MIRNNNIFSKFLLLLLLAMGWGSGAWAARFEPTFEAGFSSSSNNWYYIQFVNKGASGFMYSQAENAHFKHGNNSVQNPAYFWQLIGDNTNGFKLVSMTGEYAYWNNDFLTGTTNVNQAATFKLINGTDANSWAIQKVNPSGGYPCLNPQGSSEIKTWNNDNGCRIQFQIATAENLEAAKEIAFPSLGILGDVKLVFQDNLGRALTDQVVVYTPASGPVVHLTPTLTHYDFGNVECLKTQFTLTEDYKSLNIAYDEGSETLTFIVTTDPNCIQFSSEPSATGWAPGTKWFTIRNNRNGQANQPTRPYLSTSASFVNDSYQLINSNTPTSIDDRGGVWCFVGDMNSFTIQNAAYGPDFVLGYVNSRFTMVHKNELNGARVVFSTTNSTNTQWFDGASHGYVFRIGTTGSDQLHSNNTGFFSWNGGGSLRYDDGGSVFKVAAVDDELLASYTAYDVYNVSLVGSPSNEMSLSYNDPTKFFGKRVSLTDGSLVIMEKECSLKPYDFNISGVEGYSVKNVTVSNIEDHSCKDLTFLIADALATDEWTVKVTSDYAVTFAGTSYVNGEHFYLRPDVAPNAIDFTINAPADKFVWGPIINENARTVTYEVRDRAADLNTGWYQLQLALSESDITAIANKIHHDEGNVNTSANTLYLAPATLEPGDNKFFKITGVPDNAGEAATYVHIKNNGAGNYTLTNANTGAVYTGAFTFNGGRLEKSSGWSLEDPFHPLEGPYVKPTGSYAFAFNVAAVDVEQLKVYKILANNADVQIGINNNTILGNKVVKNGGYIFMPKNVSAPVMSQFSVHNSNDTIINVVIGAEEGGVTPINVTLDVRKSWKAVIKGDAKEEADRVIYKGVEYKDGEKMPVPDGTKPTAVEVETNVTNRFVWGPIINEKDSTVTFEVRETATSLTPGKWYQMVLYDKKPGQVFNGGVQNVTSMVEGVNSLGSLRQKSNYIYPITASSLAWAVELTGTTGADMEAQTYVYISKASASSVTMMMQNGRYVNNNGQGTTNSNENLALVYQDATKTFKWNTNAIPWNNLDNTGKVGIGNTGSASNGNMEFFMTQVPVNAYKVVLSNGSGTLVYKGEAEVVGSNRAENGRFIFAKAGQTLETDVANYELRGVDGTITGISTNTTSAGITTLNVSVAARTYNNEIIHKQNRFYDYMETDVNKPVEGFIHDGQGWNVRGGIREQNTSVFEIPVYLKQGTSIASYLPTDQLASYQRWYNWDTDSQVDTDVLTNNLSGYTEYSNGYAIFRGAQNGNGQATTPTLALPEGMTEYNVGLDISRWTDYVQNPSGASGSAIEPTLGMRIVYQVRDAKKIATAIKDSTARGSFYETHNISLPNVQYGSRASRLEDRTLSTTLPLDMDLNNYWGFNGSGTGNENLVKLTEDSQLKIELVDGGSNIQNYMMIPGSASAASGNISRTSFNTGHFVLFQYPNDGYIEPNSTATINVYMTSGSVEYKLVQFNLTFIGNAHPVVVTELKDSGRHPDALTTNFGAPVTELTFDQTPNSEFGTTENNVYYPDYRYPLDYQGASYAFGARNTGRSWAASRGEYALTSMNGSSGSTGTPRVVYYPVTNYLRSMKDPGSAFGPKEEGAYQLYIDAADQPGKIASVALNGTLCAGSRLYCYGYIGCTSGGTGQNPTSVLINVMGINKTTGKEELIYSYCPGIITLRGYAEDGRTIYSTSMGSSSSYSQRPGGKDDNDYNYWAPWQQIGFSFTIDAKTAERMRGYSFQIMNNAYNSNGGDTMLDDFQIFVNPPKGSVDFTTPLCSDKVRHAKVYTDFEMLKNISGVNEEAEDAVFTATYCFLDAEIFDGFEEGDLKIADMFVMDDKGNHNLKPEYDEDDPKVVSIINRAFRQALVGSRYTNESLKEDYGFHTYEIPLEFDSIPVYAYNDSKTEVVYREVDGQGVRRLVFKENIVRGEMQMVPAEKGNEEKHPAYWPHMRPSRTYYLVFSPILADQATIDSEETATKIFGIQDNCSFFGKFTTKDPLHVILDNADIESDLPIKAVCHGETATFSFDMPAMKVANDYPIMDEEYCISVDSLDGQIVPSTQGLKHYRFEPLFNSPEVYGIIKNMPYDWWLGGKFDETHTFRGTIEAYEAATHPTIVYDKPKDKAHKQHGDPVNIAQAMIDFRFFYPDEDGSTWSSVTRKEYNSSTGYGLLDSEIRAIKDFVDKGIIVLHRTEYSMSLTAKNAEKLTPDELSKMTSDELNSQILGLALKLDDDPAIAEKMPLKALEGKVLQMISPAGRKELTFQEFANFTHDEYKNIARKLRDEEHLLTLTDEQINAMPVADLRKTLETVLRNMSEAKLEDFAKVNFPNVGSVKRAHLVIRALNIMNDETLAKMTEEERKNPEYVRSVLRGKMIAIFSAQDPVVLRKMWKDTAAKLTPAEQAELLNGRDPEDMDAAALGVLVESALGVITNDIINDLNSDQYIHFTLIPIMPSQKNFVNEPYIFCPEPRGVKIRITTNEPRMFDGFGDMPYPNTMDNVPVRVGMSQIKAVPSQEAEGEGKVIKLPLRRLGSAQKNGHEEKRLQDSGYGNFLFLKETNDPAYQAEPVQDGSLVMKPAVMEKGGQPGDEDAYKIVGKAQALQAIYSRQDNYMNIQFDPAINFREGYTYRLGFNFMEYDSNGDPTISCYGTMVFDMKVVPEYQKWTGAVSTEWTNDQNWARADRSELHAGNTATGDKIDAAATPLDDNTSYISNEANGTASSFVPMYFTNVLLTGKETNVPELYAVTAASHSEKKFLQGLKAADDIIYDMEVAPAEGNFDCELFGTYVAGGLTFQPKAQLLNAQLLTYKKAWVEYELDVNRWYTLASPLQNTFAGEWYAPTAGGRQQTPHFYGINYRPELNHRFQPAIYQRSWDSEGNNPVYLKTETKVVEAFIKADWSHVYNDVKKEYSEGAFSVKVADEFMSNKPAEGKSLVRMPKADTQYTYYDINNETGQKADDAIAVTANRSRLWTDKLKTSESFSQTIVNQTDGNNFFLVGNPFMTAMDMDKFFEANPDLEAKYWIISANQQQVSVRGTGTTWVSTSSDKYVAPLQGFFVKAKSDSQKSLTVTYTAAMQAPQGTKPALKVRGAAQTETRNIIRLVAERDSASSTAVIMLDEQADDNFVAAEDCETFIDGNLYDLPTVFTSAGNVAQTINVRRTLDMVPLGIISADESETTLRFDLRDCHERTLQLFDSETQEYIEITDGTEVPMNGNTVGRYFLCKEPIETSLNPEEMDGIKQGVWTVGGAYLGKSVKNLRPGIYIVDGVKMVIR